MFTIENNDRFEDLRGFKEQAELNGFDMRYSFYGFNKLHYELFLMYDELTSDAHKVDDLCYAALEKGDEVYDAIRKKADEFLEKVEEFRIKRPDVMNHKNRSSLAINQMYLDVLSRGIFTFTPERFTFRSKFYRSIAELSEFFEEEEEEEEEESNDSSLE